MTDTTAAAAQAEAPPLTITLDGRQVAAEKGEVIIAVAEREGVFIPRFCYHPRMKPVGMCRMCLVEVVGPRGATLQPACYVTVADGQEVITDSPKVRKAQEGVLEFLLVNHPLDCPVCDKGGECPLQDQTLSYGPGESRFIEEKRHFEKPIPISHLVQLDRERCIQCARCTRFAEEIAGEPLIDFYGRGDRVEVSIFPGQPFSSYFSGNTVQICPVGALTATPYRFKSRPWDLEQAETTCTTCSVGCRVVVQSSAGRMVRYLGIDSDPVNQGWLCDKGRFGFAAADSEARLLSPMVRTDGSLEPAGWGNALARAASAVKGAISSKGPGSVAVIGGARLTNESAYAWAKLAKAVIGTDSTDAQLGDGLPPELVLGLPAATIDDACSAKAVVLLSPDLREELPVLFLRLRHAAVHAGLPLVELTPLPTSLSRYSKATIACRPGEAAVAAKALVDAAPDALSGPAGVLHEALAGEGADGSGIVVVLGRTSLSESEASIVDAARILAARWPGARFLTVLRRSNVRGALDMGLAPGMLPGRVTLEDGGAWYAAESAWGRVPQALGRDCRGILEAAAAGEIETLILLGADPLNDFPDRDLARRAIAAVPSVIAVDAFLTGSSSAAEVVLPAAVHGERGGSTTNLEGRVTTVAQKVVPPGVAWDDWMIAAELAAALGSELGLDSIEQIAGEIERLAPSHRGLTDDVLGSPALRDGVVLPIAAAGVGVSAIGVRRSGSLPIDPIAIPGIRAVELQGAPIRSGSAMPEAALPEAALPEAALPGAALPEATPEAAEPREQPAPRPPLVKFAAGGSESPVPAPDSYSLRLVSRRRLYDAGTLVSNTRILCDLAETPRLAAHPGDLDRLGVSTGDKVRVRSPRGEAVVEVQADAEVPRGVASLAFNLPFGDERAGDLIDSSQPVVDVRLETI